MIFMGNEGNIYWGQLSAVAVITCSPVALLFSLFQELAEALTAGP